MEQKDQAKTIEDIRKKFEQWRLSKKNSREPIPAKLWKSAVLLTNDHSINAVAKCLRLNGQDLRKQVVIYRGNNQAKTQAPTNFIELPCKPPISLSECIIELSDQTGITMRISLKDNQKLDIFGLISSFCAERR